MKRVSAVKDKKRLLTLFFVFPLPSFAIIILSLIIHFFTQNTQLVPKVSSRAWHPLSLSTVVVTPSPVGSHFLSEGTLSKNELNKCSFRHRSDLYLVGLWLWWAFVYIFQSLQISGCFSGWWSNNRISVVYAYSSMQLFHLKKKKKMPFFVEML